MPENVANCPKSDFPPRPKSANSNSSTKSFLPRHFKKWLPSPISPRQNPLENPNFSPKFWGEMTLWLLKGVAKVKEASLKFGRILKTSFTLFMVQIKFDINISLRSAHVERQDYELELCLLQILFNIMAIYWVFTWCKGQPDGTTWCVFREKFQNSNYVPFFRNPSKLTVEHNQE